MPILLVHQSCLKNLPLVKRGNTRGIIDCDALSCSNIHKSPLAPLLGKGDFVLILFDVLKIDFQR